MTSTSRARKALMIDSVSGMNLNVIESRYGNCCPVSLSIFQ